MERKRENTKWLGLLLIVLLGWIFTGWWQRKLYERERTDWREQKELLTKESHKAVIVRRVSEQMEEMAYQQKEISDQRWQEAVRQKRYAEKMQQLAEKEAAGALASRAQALAAFHRAEEQKKIADQRREEAIRAQARADTLAGLALGRSLGAFAIGQYQEGNKEIAELLGYYAWKYTSDNGGDCYQPAVLNALTLVSESATECYKHRGAIRSVAGVGKKGEMNWISVSEEGEVVFWEHHSGKWKGKELYKAPDLDFRKVAWDKENEKIFVLAWSGVLLTLKGKNYEQAELWDSGETGARDLILKDGVPFIMYRNGKVAGPKGMETVGESLPERWTSLKEDLSVTAVAWDARTLREAVGYEGGRIVLREKGIQRTLSGHIAAVTDLVLEESTLLSVSYDGRLNLWNLQAGKPEPIVLAAYQDWLYAVGKVGERVACGGRNGVLYIHSVSPKEMAEKLKSRLKRDFTVEERQYYLNGRKGGIE